MSDYYAEKLSAERLKRCYDIVPPRVLQYLKAESDYVLSNIKADDSLLELGCGYGRVLKEFCPHAKAVTGIDNSISNLKMAKEYLNEFDNNYLSMMNAVKLGFVDNAFDVTVCIQNGISAFKVNQSGLIAEAIRITRLGGTVLFSSYSEKFWDDRLHWFEIQACEKLLGEIDYDATGDGVIICKDGFRATTITPAQFESLTLELNLKAEILEIDQSSLFCKIMV